MTGPQETVCFTCGQPAGDSPRLNYLPSGQVCPSCRDRLLESLPALLPAEEEPSEAEAAELEELESGPEPSSGSETEARAEEGTEGGEAPIHAPKGPGQILYGNGPDQPA